MRALALDGVGGLERLAVRNVPEPVVTSRTDVRVRVRMAALNRLDLFVAGGLPGVDYTFPHVIGSDAAGIVDQVGPDVQSLAVGDRVMINAGLSCGRCSFCLEGDDTLCRTFRVLGEHVPGTAAEYVVLPQANVARVPDAMPFEHAAAFSLATLTAWRMLTTRAALRPGEAVLIWGIGGGVAQAALRVARLVGAFAIVTSGSDEKLAAAKARGANVGINHATADVVAEVRGHTGGRGADVIVDSVGERSWNDSLRALRRGGRLVICGATTGPQVAMDLRRLFWHQWSILGSTMGSRREYAEIVRLAAQGHLWPDVDSVVPLDQAVGALGRLAAGEQFGKIVIEVSK